MIFQKIKNSLKVSKNDAIETLLLLPTFVLFNLIQTNVATCVETEGPSMEPTLTEGSVLLVDRFFYKMFGGIHKNDVILAISPAEMGTSICKRVVHTENESFEIKKGDRSVVPFKVPENHVWIEGDNKNRSFDSRHHGAVPNDLITGRVLCSLYPFKSFMS